MAASITLTTKKPTIVNGGWVEADFELTNHLGRFSDQPATRERPTMSDVEYDVRRQTEAAKLLISSLHEAGAGDDEDLRADAVDGETDLNEALAAALAEIDEREILIKGLKAKEGEFAERRDREERGVERIRTLIEQALLTAELPSMKLPTATLSIARRKPGVVVTNEADIPSRFWVIPDPQPRLDKKALADALAANENVPGASLDNGTVSLTIRRK